jgi:hypothetical protein
LFGFVALAFVEHDEQIKSLFLFLARLVNEGYQAVELTYQ